MVSLTDYTFQWLVVTVRLVVKAFDYVTNSLSSTLPTLPAENTQLEHWDSFGATVLLM